MDRDQAGDAASEVRVVAEWHEALNGGDVERLVGLSHPDVEMGGPRGTVHGTRVLREWVDRAGINLSPRRFFHANEAVVVDQEAAWTSADTGEMTPSQIVASVFVVQDGLVTSVVRHARLADALGAMGLDESDEVEGA